MVGTPVGETVVGEIVVKDVGVRELAVGGAVNSLAVGLDDGGRAEGESVGGGVGTPAVQTICLRVRE